MTINVTAISALGVLIPVSIAPPLSARVAEDCWPLVYINNHAGAPVVVDLGIDFSGKAVDECDGCKLNAVMISVTWPIDSTVAAMGWPGYGASGLSAKAASTTFHSSSGGFEYECAGAAGGFVTDGVATTNIEFICQACL